MAAVPSTTFYLARIFFVRSSCASHFPRARRRARDVLRCGGYGGGGGARARYFTLRHPVSPGHCTAVLSVTAVAIAGPPSLWRPRGENRLRVALQRRARARARATTRERTHARAARYAVVLLLYIYKIYIIYVYIYTRACIYLIYVSTRGVCARARARTIVINTRAGVRGSGG